VPMPGMEARSNFSKLYRLSGPGLKTQRNQEACSYDGSVVAEEEKVAWIGVFSFMF